MKIIFSLLFFAVSAQATFVAPSNSGRPNKAMAVSSSDYTWANPGWVKTKQSQPVADVTNFDSVIEEMNSKRKRGEPAVEKILDPSYFFTWMIAAVGPVVSGLNPPEIDGSPNLIGTAGNLFHLLLAALLWVQTRRVRCVFEEDGFEFYNIKGNGLDLNNGARLERKPGNFVVGTDNRWRYDKITGYQFFPSEALPVICVLTETQTGEGKAYYGAQPHFFPSLFSAQEFKNEMSKRGVKYGL